MTDKTIWGIHMPLELGLGPVGSAYVAIGWENMGIYTPCIRRTNGVYNGV